MLLRPWAVLWITALLLHRASVAQYTSDQCSWRGSGLSHEFHRRDVEQVYLRCSKGSLEWLYPTGAIIVNMRPNIQPSSRRASGLHVCIKPLTYSQGSHVYLEHAGGLRLLLADENHAQDAILCFSLAERALYVEAVPQNDISRRITAFQYELVSSQSPGALMYPYLHHDLVTCKPCSDEEILMAVCTSDFAGRGTFHRVASGSEKSTRAVATLSRLFRQKGGVFAWSGGRGRSWSGHVNVPTQCGVYMGGDEYLLTGSIHFGEAWLSCAPRYKDFLQLYIKARRTRTNPCQIDTN
ncbi:meteorin-like protein [Gouania willdenowi]|uniref:Meteorin-like protein n=1 Tax=Gouania willdenowi TaxID=441366 RepID=A0A8C5FY00_GOUWI|nr:meteorin-like protein [Gouania willdenowi]